MRTLLLTLTLFSPTLAHAKAAGVEAFDFLLLDAGARPAALGGAYTSLAQDAHALQYNPAGLAGVCQSQATFMHNQHFQGITQEFASVALKEGFGLNLNYLDFGTINETTISQIDGTGAKASMSDLAIGIGYGREIGSGVSLGIGAKFLREVIAGYTASGFAVNLGVGYKANDRLSLGYAIQNLGGKVKFQSKKEAISMLHRLGAAYRMRAAGKPLLLTADLIKEKSEGMNVAAGVELAVMQKLGLRLGYATRNDAGMGLTLGFGWNEPRWSLDYAFVPFGDLGSANRVSVTWRFDAACGPELVVSVVEPPAPLPPPPPAPEPEPVPVPVPEPPPAVPITPQYTTAENSAIGRLNALALPGTVTPGIVAGVLGAAGDPSCPWDNEGVMCVKLAMEFEHDKSDMKGDFMNQLREIGAFLKSNPRAKIDLQGHTDNKGGMDHNIRLSRARAKAVKQHLVTQEAVEDARLTAKGLGYAKPTAPNDTDEGRQRNRRVMAILTFQ